MLDGFLDRARATAAQPLPEEVFRACHTLHGSLTMAGVEPAVAVAGPLNDLVGVLFEPPRRASVGAGSLPGSQRPLRPSWAICGIRPCRCRIPPLTARIEVLTAEVADMAAAVESGPADTGTLSLEVSVIEVAELDPGPVEEVPAGSGRSPELSAGSELPADVPAAAMTFFDVEVAEIFAEEAAELLESCEHALAQLSVAPGNEPAMAELQRGLHTLKGGARMAGLPAMGDLSHELETLLIRTVDGELKVTAATWALVQAALDELHRLRDQIVTGTVGPVSPAIMGRLATALRGEPEKAPESDVAAAGMGPVSEEPIQESIQEPIAEQIPAPQPPADVPEEAPVEWLEAVEEELPTCTGSVTAEPPPWKSSLRMNGARSLPKKSRRFPRRSFPRRKRRRPPSKCRSHLPRCRHRSKDWANLPRAGSASRAGAGRAAAGSSGAGSEARRTAGIRARRARSPGQLLNGAGEISIANSLPQPAAVVDPVQPGGAEPDRGPAARTAAQAGDRDGGADSLPSPGRSCARR